MFYFLYKINFPNFYQAYCTPLSESKIKKSFCTCLFSTPYFRQQQSFQTPWSHVLILLCLYAVFLLPNDSYAGRLHYTSHMVLGCFNSQCIEILAYLQATRPLLTHFMHSFIFVSRWTILSCRAFIFALTQKEQPLVFTFKVLNKRKLQGWLNVNLAEKLPS